jgi:hypothetical protein
MHMKHAEQKSIIIINTYFVELFIITPFLINSMILLTQTYLRLCNITHAASYNNHGTIRISNSYKQWVFIDVISFIYKIQFSTQYNFNTLHKT